jgi:hypothetical protein
MGLQTEEREPVGLHFIGRKLEMLHKSSMLLLSLQQRMLPVEQRWDVYVMPCYPSGVQNIIVTGRNQYIGFVVDSAILQYPHFKRTPDGRRVGCRIFQQPGRAPRIIDFTGEHNTGILLEHAENGSLNFRLITEQVPLMVMALVYRRTTDGLPHAHPDDLHIQSIFRPWF